MTIDEELSKIEVPVRVTSYVDGTSKVESFVYLPPEVIKRIKEIFRRDK